MNPSTVQKFGIFIMILGAIASLTIFLGIIFSPLFLIFGLLLGWAYYNNGKTSTKVNNLISSSVWVNGVASLLLLANIILTIYVIASYGPGSQNYTHMILFSLASVPIAALYFIGLLLLLFGWEDKNSEEANLTT